MKLRTIPVWLTLVLGSVLFLLPFYVMLVMSLKTPSQIAMTGVWTWPSPPTWANYEEVLRNPNVNFALLFRNTIVISLLATLGTVASSAMVAYAFARLKFAGRDRLFIILLSTMMLPGVVTLIPGYVLFAKLHMVNTFLPLTLPSFFGAAYNIFLLRQFFMSLPRELDEAALLDGASYWTVFSKVVLPLSGPALTTVGVFALIWNWRDFMGPLLYLTEPNKQTLETGLRMYQGLNDNQWHLLMAASVLVCLPLIVIFFVGQRAFVKGIVMTGGK